MALLPTKRDLAHAGLDALDDRVDDVDPAVRQLDDARRHRGEAAAGALVNLADAGRVGLEHRLGERPARLGLDLALEHFARNLAAALENDPVDGVVLADRDDDLRAAARDADVGEHAAGQEAAARLLERAGTAARHVRAHGLGIDAAIAFHDDLLRRGAAGDRQGSRHRKSRDGNVSGRTPPAYPRRQCHQLARIVFRCRGVTPRVGWREPPEPFWSIPLLPGF